MTPLILAGGLGTRLSVHFPDRPKALVPVAGRPFLNWQVTWLRTQGFDHVHIAAGYRGHMLENWARTHGVPGITVTVSVEPQPLGTAGGLRYAAINVTDDPLLVLNGDSFLPSLRIADFLAECRPLQASVGLAITRIEEAGRYGTVTFDERSVVTAFREKTQQTEGWVNGGVYVMRRSVLSRIPSGCTSSLETDLFPTLAAERQVVVHSTPPPLLDMGTPDGLSALETYLREKWKPPASDRADTT